MRRTVAGSVLGMQPDAPADLLAIAARWPQLPAWERAELGRSLRRLGWTYGEIRDVIPVPKATLAGWCRDITLSPAQVADIKARTGSRRDVPRDTQRKRRAEIAQIRADARVFAGEHLQDPLFVAGTVLYWGEGAKTERLLTFANSDPAAHRLFIRWTRAFHDEHAEFVLSLHLHHGNDDQRARQWWAETLNLEEADFTKTFIKPPGTGHRKNKLSHGVCRVRMRRSADAWHRTLAWIEVIAERFGADERSAGC
jgi:hypothetical protein